MVRSVTWRLGLPAAFALAIGLLAHGQPRRRPPERTPAPKTGRPGPKKLDPEAPPVAPVHELMKLYEARQYTTLRGTMPYRMLRPLNYAARRKFPMVVCLHGVPGRGKDNVLQLAATYPVTVLARPAMRQKHPCFVLAPQSPTWWGDQPYGTLPGTKASGKDFPAVSLLIECIEALEGVFAIDPNRVYLTGHGMGGFGAFNVLRSRPDFFAAATTVSGGGDPNSAIELYHTPMWLFAGEKSGIRHYSETMVAALKKFGGAPKYTMVPDAPTTCWPAVYDGDAVWDWLFAQRKVPKPVLPTSLPTTLPTTLPSLLLPPAPPPKPK